MAACEDAAPNAAATNSEVILAFVFMCILRKCLARIRTRKVSAGASEPLSIDPLRKPRRETKA
jgi:hypothetical protein